MTLPERRSERRGVDADLTRWDPFQELDDLRSRMNQLFDAALGGGESSMFRFEPPVDIEETDDAFLVEADLPGVRREDVDVELVDNQLQIRGESKERERVGILRRRTRRTGEFDYRVTLPGEVDAENVEAQLEDGLLQLRIPKAATAQRRRIEVKVR